MSEQSEDPPTQPVRVRDGEPEELVERDDTKISSTYAMGAVIGRGGMGEVLLAHDRRIGRDVAIKRLRDGAPSEDDVARFLREARIQARLEHPAVVPVYELSRDAAGRPYFTMKRLSGVTLSEMIASPAPTRQRLLRAFADVCRAIDFAHQRGVVHRDLKPSNIILGEYGEVYVLDWGAARVIEGAESSLVTADIDTIEGTAPVGQVLGTPGYMAPEQLDNPEVERAADVYSLGTVLFEILAGEPLHLRGSSPNVAIASTLGDIDASPAKRRPERGIAPELDALCVSALARDPQLRPTARRLADKIESFLDGDRDVERRKTMATDLVWSARAALDEGRRADAMRAASRALALDPELNDAADLLTRLMLVPPSEPPPELQIMLQRSDAEIVRRRARAAIIAYLSIASFLPIAAWNGVRKWSVILSIFFFAIAMAIAAVQLRRKPDRTFVEMLLYAIGNAALLVLMSRMAGPFTFVPALACFMTMSMTSYPAFANRVWALIATICIGFLLPIVFEHIGWLSQTWELRPGELVSHAGALEVGNTSSLWMVIVASVVTIVIAGVYASTVASANRGAQHQLVTQAWHLRQLLPQASTPPP
jgi:eukaryotic-like serine/threonine-protein kinase